MDDGLDSVNVKTVDLKYILEIGSSELDGVGSNREGSI